MEDNLDLENENENENKVEFDYNTMYLSELIDPAVKKKISKKLNFIGKNVFTKNYYLFKEIDRYTFTEMVEQFKGDYTLGSKQSRASHARSLFKDGLEKEALILIFESRLVDERAVKRAKKILDDEFPGTVPEREVFKRSYYMRDTSKYAPKTKRKKGSK